MSRAVHGLMSVAMLAGMSLALAGALAAVASEMAGIAARDAGCQIWRADIYSVSNSTAYLSVSASNTGSVAWSSASAHLAGAGPGLPGGPAAPGGAWEAAGPVAALVAPGEQYLVRVSVAAEDGSEAVCARLARAQRPRRTG